jgi:threonine dehydratase
VDGTRSGAVEQDGAGHALVRVGVVDGDPPLVAEQDGQLLPLEAATLPQRRVAALGGAAAGQREGAGRARRQHPDEGGGDVLDDPDVIEGQATCATELLAQLPADTAADLLVLPVGGGGLSCGMVEVMDACSPATVCRFVEPSGAPSLRRALEAGQPVTLNEVDNFVDGAAVARIGDLNFATLGRFVPADVVLAPEDRVCATMVEMLNIEGLVLEPAGALAVDALRDFAALEGRTVVAVISGGNFDFERLPDVKERALRWQGRKRYYILRLPQRPGALRDFLTVLGPDDDITRFEYLKKSARNFGSVLLGIETSARENFESLEARMSAAGFSYIDITGDAVITSLIV